MQLWNKISDIGLVSGLSVAEERSLVFINRISAILMVVVTTSIAINLLLGSYIFIPVLVLAAFCLVMIYIFNHYRWYAAARVLLMCVTLSLLFYMCVRAGLGSGLEFYFISLTLLPVLIFKSSRSIMFFQLLCIACLIGQKVLVDIIRPEDPSRAIEYQVFYIVNGFYSCLLVITAIFFFRNLIRKRETQLEASYETISAKNQQLESANKELDTFTYSVSHDLRGPLRAIDGFSHLLQRKQAVQQDKDSTELLDLIRQNTFKMRDLIEDLLKLSRLNKATLVKSRVDMQALVQEVLQELSPEIKESGAEVKVSALPYAFADAVLIKQVWLNLISNAVKYSSKSRHPLIEIGAGAEKGSCYNIKDNGIGFDMKHAAKLFEPFQRLHNSTDYSGTGVGLAIVHNIVIAHGGSVGAESEVNKGSTFTFCLPVA